MSGMKRNFEFIKLTLKCDKNGRSPGTFTSYDSLDDHIDSIYYHLQFLKFGFGRCWRDASRHIQLGQINISEAINFIQKYDDELNEYDLSETMKFLKLSRIEFFEILENIGIKKFGKKLEINTLIKLPF